MECNVFCILHSLSWVSTRESVILLGNSCGFPQNLCANYIEMGLICKSPEISFNPTYHAIKIDYPFFRSVRHVRVLTALVLNVDIRKTKVIFAVYGVQTTVLMEVRIFWNAFASPIGYRLFGIIRIFFRNVAHIYQSTLLYHLRGFKSSY